MAVIQNSWFIDPASPQYRTHPGQWAYKEFEAWAFEQEPGGQGQAFLKKGQAKYIIQTFDNVLKSGQFHSMVNRLRSHAQQYGIPGAAIAAIDLKSKKIFKQYQSMTQEPNSTHPYNSNNQPINITRIQQLAAAQGFIWFYKAPENTTTECFGNFYEVAGGVLGCRTAEGAFQKQKFVQNLHQSFQNLDGDAAWHLAQNLAASGNAIKANWHQGEKVNAMKRVLADKFKPGTPLAAALLATGNAYLVEHTPTKGRDAYWSDDSDGTGSNMLGVLLMQQRKALGGSGVVPPPQAYLYNVRNLK